MPVPESGPRQEQDAYAAAPAAELVGPPRPLALTPLARKPRRPVRPARGDAALPIPVRRALLAAFGVLVLALCLFMVVRWQQRTESEAAARAARQAIEQIERDNQERAEAERLAAQQRQRQLDAQEQARTERIRAEQSRAEEAQKSRLGEAERRERAWAAYYRKPPRCNDAATLECANHYIRARREFDERFARGEL